MLEITFKIAATKEELKAARDIRRKVFSIEQGIPAELDLDEDEERSIHLLALIQPTQFIGTGRLTINTNTGILSRISIVESYRNKGIGKLIIMKLEAIAKEKALTTLTLSPHSYLEDFYSSLGYSKIEGEKVVGKYTLLSMIKKIA
jgi:predicted GNAT family N-acyltransferase